MRSLVGVLAIGLTFLLLIPGNGLTQGKDYEKRYGIELQLGGGYYAMEDVNAYNPHNSFTNNLRDDKNIHFGSQFGMGISFRGTEEFGWLFGYNLLKAGFPIAYTEKYRQSAFVGSAINESWAEQTVSGGEFYMLPTWYWGLGEMEMFFSAGPAIYWANLDRSISLVTSSSNGVDAPAIASGSFDDASGKALGLIVSTGIEFGISELYFLNIRAGGRFANASEVAWEDAAGDDNVVVKNTGVNSTLGVDFSGGFINIGIRTYFKPSSEWRSPRQ